MVEVNELHEVFHNSSHYFAVVLYFNRPKESK